MDLDTVKAGSVDRVLGPLGVKFSIFIDLLHGQWSQPLFSPFERNIGCRNV
jgi:hypothetical protein